MQLFQRILRGLLADDGHTPVEQATLLALVAVAAIAGIQSVGGVTLSAFQQTEQVISSSDATGSRSSSSVASQRRVRNDDLGENEPSRIEERRRALRVSAAQSRRRDEWKSDAESSETPTRPPRFAEHRRPDVDPMR